MLKHITEGANLTKHSIKHSEQRSEITWWTSMMWFICYAFISCFPCSRRRSTSATYSLTSVPYHLHALCFTKSEKSQGSASSLLGSRNTYVSASVAAGRSVPWDGRDGKNSLNWRKWVDIPARGPSWWTLTGSLLYSYSQEHRYLFQPVSMISLTLPSKKSNNWMSTVVNPVTNVPFTQVSSSDNILPWNSSLWLSASGMSPGYSCFYFTQSTI